MPESCQSYDSNEESDKSYIARSSPKPAAINALNTCADKCLTKTLATLTKQSIQLHFSQTHFQHLPIRAFSDKYDPIWSQRFT